MSFVSLMSRATCSYSSATFQTSCVLEHTSFLRVWLSTHSLEESSIMLFQYTTRVRFYDLYYYISVQWRAFDRQLDPSQRKKQTRFKVPRYRGIENFIFIGIWYNEREASKNRFIEIWCNIDIIFDDRCCRNHRHHHTITIFLKHRKI